MILGRDGYGTFANYVPPLIVNGKVYVASFFPGGIDAYGLLPYTVQPISLAFGTWQTNTSSPPIIGDGDEHRRGTCPAHRQRHDQRGQRRRLLADQHLRRIGAGRGLLYHQRGLQVLCQRSECGDPECRRCEWNRNANGGAQRFHTLPQAIRYRPRPLAFGTIATNTTSPPAATLQHGDEHASSAALPISINIALGRPYEPCGVFAGQYLRQLGSGRFVLHHQRDIRADIGGSESGEHVNVILSRAVERGCRRVTPSASRLYLIARQ